MLEMQFAQSLLHRLFRDELQCILNERSAQPLRTSQDLPRSRCGGRSCDVCNCFMTVIAEVLL
jgi:hypothetical protein